jgi:hypothetical protein
VPPELFAVFAEDHAGAVHQRVRHRAADDQPVARAFGPCRLHPFVDGVAEALVEHDFRRERRDLRA